MTQKYKILITTIVVFLLSAYVAVYELLPAVARLDFYILGRRVNPQFQLKRGLDIQGGMQVVLQADMSNIKAENQEQAITAAKEIIYRRVDLYGINEPRIQTSKTGDQYRIIVELPGIQDQQQALELVGKTAQLEFRLQKQDVSPAATQSATAFLDSFEATDLTGQDLAQAQLSFSQQTGEPVVALEFTSQGRGKFADITKNNQGQILGIFIDNQPVTTPVINDPILDGRAIISGAFTVDEAENTAIQLNAGALPVPIEVIEQKAIGATLGEQSVQQSVTAGLIGLGLVMLFMILYYGGQGLVASVVLVVYAALTVAVYKLFGVTLTLPGIAGLLLSIGMAVDSNILVFERTKEELRRGLPYKKAMEQGFGKSWDGIKDANVATIMTALVLINPLNFQFLNSSGLVRGFGLTLLIGVVISTITGVFISRNFLRIAAPLFERWHYFKHKGDQQ